MCRPGGTTVHAVRIGNSIELMCALLLTDPSVALGIIAMDVCDDRTNKSLPPPPKFVAVKVRKNMTANGTADRGFQRRDLSHLIFAR